MRKREEEFIEIIIDDDGIHMDAIGFHGKGCHDVMTKLQAGLGRLKQTTRKPEFFENKIQAQNKIKG
jgi:hypothetical protein